MRILSRSPPSMEPDNGARSYDHDLSPNPELHAQRTEPPKCPKAPSILRTRKEGTIGKTKDPAFKPLCLFNSFRAPEMNGDMW